MAAAAPLSRPEVLSKTASLKTLGDVKKMTFPYHTEKKDDFTVEEVNLANRCHGLQLEALNLDLTPVGMHYLLIHFDVPTNIDEGKYRLKLRGFFDKKLDLSLADLRRRPRVSVPVTMECAGNGRVNMKKRYWTHVPWNMEAIGTAVWTGVPLKDLLADAGLKNDAVELLFTGMDKGIQGGELQYYQRSLSIEDATKGEVLLAYEMNGQPLLPQHGAPLRLIVPGWYGMTNVKWLDSIEAISTRFDGYQMQAYTFTKFPGDPETKRMREIKVRSLMVPPGIPDFFTRVRLVEEGDVPLFGRAWAGPRAVKRVLVSTDGGSSWDDATLAPKPVGKFAWIGWSYLWKDARVGKHFLMTKAIDEQGNVQDETEEWNYYAMGATMPQSVPVLVISEAEWRITGKQLHNAPRHPKL
jgi:DMSO/TMAO reductase YedYZ molybdopterin-dependent catalytic subunit